MAIEWLMTHPQVAETIPEVEAQTQTTPAPQNSPPANFFIDQDPMTSDASADQPSSSKDVPSSSKDLKVKHFILFFQYCTQEKHYQLKKSAVIIKGRTIVFQGLEGITLSKLHSIILKDYSSGERCTIQNMKTQLSAAWRSSRTIEGRSFSYILSALPSALTLLPKSLSGNRAL